MAERNKLDILHLLKKILSILHARSKSFDLAKLSAMSQQIILFDFVNICFSYQILTLREDFCKNTIQFKHYHHLLHSGKYLSPFKNFVKWKKKKGFVKLLKIVNWNLLKEQNLKKNNSKYVKFVLVHQYHLKINVQINYFL